MSDRRELRVEGLSEPLSHYTDAVAVSGGLVFVSGMLGVDGDGRLVADDVVGQARQALANLEAALAAAGAGLGDVAKVTVYLTDIDDRARINPVRQERFGDRRPASTLVEVSALALPGALVEIECVAVLPG